MPTYLGWLGASKSGTGDAVWSWTSGGAAGFDLMRGDLLALRATGGDFGAALNALPGGENACLANNINTLSVADPYGPPAPESGLFMLLRPVTTSCPAEGTLDERVASQIGSRDAESAASPLACP
jgi:hypothetical protein